MADSPSTLSANKQALLKIRELKQRLAAADTATTYEPVAIVSMACRFPRRATSPERFWQSLVEQTDETGEVPEDRWDLEAFFDEDPEIPGRMYARRGVFLDQVDQMDPEFFGISPREATWVDPQQRLLMEVGWEALERAGWVPAQIGEQTGVFVGWMHNDYQNEASDSFLNLNPYIATGAAGSFLCGRLAYYLGLQGPSLAVDTACSSSLVALHLACQSLQRRDCDRALVGGVNVICSPTTNILTCKLKALSPRGHSRAFDAAADGYLRGEGCGVVAIRRLADAQRDGDPILGVIRGSAVGHNGFSSGLTAPNPKAQEKVIRQAVDRANLAPEDVSYLEAHGTGTELGDPIEMQAAAAALTGQRTSETPLLVGSVKTNIGHLEAAAGMAGLIKVLLSLQQNRIPGQLNFETPNPHIAWDAIPVRVLTAETAWPATQRVAGVSAFGMSGTNAHVVVGEADKATPGTSEQTATEDPAKPFCLVTISGRTEDALRQQAEQLEHALTDDPDLSLVDVAHTLGARRTHFDHRAGIVVAERTDAQRLLSSVARGGTKGVASGHGRQSPKTAWQFTGQGSQYAGMARELYETEAVFREAIDWCEAGLQSLRSERLTDVLFQHEDHVHHTSWTQPALFAVQMGLARVLEDRGLQPDVVLGHSVGQYAAACVAGIMSWEDGLRLIAERGRLIGDLPTGGQMMAVFAPVDVVAQAVSGQLDVCLAASNGTHAVMSGVADVVTETGRQLQEQGLRCVPLTTSHAFHSDLMNPALEPFAKFASGVSFQPARIPLVCNVTGQMLPADARLDGQYWADHIRAAVRYAESVDTVQQLGCDMMLELGPQGVLTRMAAANWKSAGDRLVSCLNKDGGDQRALLTAIGRLYAHGHQPDFHRVNPTGRHVVLPTYPFQRRRFWGPDKPRAAHAAFHTAHPLLGGEIRLAGAGREQRFESFVEHDSPPWLPDHEVMGNVVMPGAAYVEMALAAGEGVIEDLVFEQPLRPLGRTTLQTVIRPAESGQVIETWSSAADSPEWQRHFTAVIAAGPAAAPSDVDPAALQQAISEEVSVADFYAKLQEIGLNYGNAFQTVQALSVSESGVLAKLSTEADVRGFQVPPPLLDGALHALAVGLLQDDDGHLFLPVGMKRVVCHAAIDGDVWCHAAWTEKEGRIRTADLTLFDEAGTVLLTIAELKVQQVSRDVLRQMSGVGVERLLHDLQWRSFRLPAADTTARRWLVVDGGGTSDYAAGVREALTAAGHEVVGLTVREAAEFQADASAFQFDARQGAQWQKLFQHLDARLHEPQAASDADDSAAHSGQWQPEGIVWLLDADQQATDSALGAAGQNCGGLVELTKVLLERGQRRIRCGLQLVTAGAIATTTTEDCSPHQARYWGFGRVIGAEQPEFRCRLIDLAVTDANAEHNTRAVLDVLMTETRENQLLLRDGGWLVPRLQRVTGVRGQSAVPPVNPEGSYLITGGLGILGRHAAEWLARHGATQVVLVSRRQPDESAVAFLQALQQRGCEVIVHAADLGDRSHVETMIGQFGDHWKPLSGVIHAAGVLDDGLIESQTWERFERVLSPKIIGASLLDELTGELPLDFFVLYSSAAAVLGSPGQSNYATANAFMDGLAWQRRLLGRPATSINWGPWAAGMADDERILKRLALQGIAPLDVAEAHEVMGLMLSLQQVQGTVMDVDWRRMRTGPGGEASTLLEELAPARQRAATGDSELVARLRKLRGTARRQLLVDTVRASLQRILSTPEPPELDRPLIEMGLDSLMAVEFGTELQQMLGDQFAVGPTMLFDHPTIDAISDYVLSLMTDDGEEESPSEPAEPVIEEQGLRPREPIAIIGLSCRFPGAHNADEFWENLLQGVDSVRDIPTDRWDIDRFYREDRQPGFMYTREGGFLDDIADFDAAFFNISDQEACWIDPQHRMLLENSYRALEDAGIATAPLADSNVGVFMGIMGQDYAFLPTLDDQHVIEAFQGAGLSHSAGVGRISYVFGFEGPSIAVDTASSSSLVALHQAMRSLQDGHCNMALAGGVNAILAPVNSLLMSKAGLLSPDGRCKSFSAQADGFGRGEGCGVVVLKRLSDAVANGDRVLAVVKGGAVVHNGTSSGITAPSSKSQSRVITEALKDARVAPSQVQYLEAHGTGTEFGDPMELGAAAAVYGKGRKRDQPLLVGSVKANISHLEAAGGISGLIKAVLAIDRGVLPPQAHFAEPSPHIPWRRLPLQMVTQTTPWPETSERLAGVTALGLVGTNAHVILASPPSAAAADGEAVTDSGQAEDAGTAGEPESSRGERITPKVRLLTLSARNPAALRQLVENYRIHCGTDGICFDDLCHTAGVGRRHFEHRLACTAPTAEAAVTQLSAWLARADNEDPVTSSNGGSAQVAWLFGDAGDGRELGRQLYADEPAFRDIIARFDQRLDAESEWQGPALQQWFTGAEQSGTLAAEVGCYVLQAALAQMYRGWGIEPDVVAGVGVGQYVASAVAGGVCFQDALMLVIRRQAALVDPDDATLGEFEAYADSFNYYPPNMPLVCSVSGDMVPVHRSLAGAWWREHLTASPAADRLVNELLTQECGVVMEFCCDSPLSLTVAAEIPAKSFIHLKCAEANSEASSTTVEVLGRLYEAGITPDFAGFYRPWSFRKVALPLYPFQKKRYWITEVDRYATSTEAVNS